ncbi:response regulator [Nonomuraea sp. NPDC050451]|uniref:response regulator n=1 Tax=Nonomuraea sp. NPDC050451 TaxID=3364364 RepID=UPI003797D8A2
MLIADDQDLVRGGLAALLSLEDDIEVVAAAEEHDPDVILLDIEMPGLSGLEVAEQLRDRKVIIVTTFGRPGYLNRAPAARMPAWTAQARAEISIRVWSVGATRQESTTFPRSRRSPMGEVSRAVRSISYGLPA